MFWPNVAFPFFFISIVELEHVAPLSIVQE
jgi:hypothetical protein